MFHNRWWRNRSDVERIELQQNWLWRGTHSICWTTCYRMQNELSFLFDSCMLFHFIIFQFLKEIFLLFQIWYYNVIEMNCFLFSLTLDRFQMILTWVNVFHISKKLIWELFDFVLKFCDISILLLKEFSLSSTFEDAIHWPNKFFNAVLWYSILSKCN
jgi:hypothetical protein